MKLKKVQIHKYKSFENEQFFDVETDISILVGMNESGKTSVLEAIGKTNYFQDDEDFNFNFTLDYPRKEKKKVDKSGENPKAVTCTYEISDELLSKISEDVGKNVFQSKEFSVTTFYKKASRTFGGIDADKNKFIQGKIKNAKIESNSLIEKLNKVSSKEDFNNLKETYKNETYKSLFGELEKYFEWNIL